MVRADIPGFGCLELDHLVLDYNGTLAVGGIVLDGVADALRSLSGHLEIHVVTADTFGVAAAALATLPVSLTIAPVDGQDELKREFVTALRPEHVVAIGNGRNDRLMLEAAGLGIALIQAEGAAAETLRRADVVCTSILDALGLLRDPRRLIATLRS